MCKSVHSPFSLGSCCSLSFDLAGDLERDRDAPLLDPLDLDALGLRLLLRLLDLDALLRAGLRLRDRDRLLDRLVLSLDRDLDRDLQVVVM